MEKFDISDLSRDIYSLEPEVALAALQKIRTLTVQNDPPDLASHPELLRRLVEILAKDDEPSMQHEAAWIVTNITSGSTESTRSVVLSGAVPLLIGLIQSRDEDVQEQALMALGNIVGDDHQTKGYVLSLGIIETLLNLVQAENIPRMRLSCLRLIAWVMVNLCRHCDSPQPVTQLKKLLPSLYDLVQHTDIVIQADILWALSNLTERNSELVHLVACSKVIPTLVTLLDNHNPRVHKPCLKIIQNIMEALPSQKKTILSCYGHRLTTNMKQKLNFITDPD